MQERGLLLAGVPDVRDEDDALEDNHDAAVEEEGGEQVLVDGDSLDSKHSAKRERERKMQDNCYSGTSN